MFLHTQQQTIIPFSFSLLLQTKYPVDLRAFQTVRKDQLKGEKGEEWWPHRRLQKMECVHLLSVILRETTHVIQGSHSQRGALPRRSSAAVFVCCVRPFAAIAWTSPTVPFYMRNGPYAQSCVVLLPDSRLERLHNIC